MKIPPLDGPTFREATAALIRAQDLGLDPVEELHRAGLLLTPDRRKAIQLRAMQYVWDEMDNWQPHEMLRSMYRPDYPATPADMYVAVQAWINSHIEAVKEEPT